MLQEEIIAAPEETDLTILQPEVHEILPVLIDLAQQDQVRQVLALALEEVVAEVLDEAADADKFQNKKIKLN